jgi:hypothetical protein
LRISLDKSAHRGDTANMVADYTEEEIKKAHEILFNEGVKTK